MKCVHARVVSIEKKERASAGIYNEMRVGFERDEGVSHKARNSIWTQFHRKVSHFYQQFISTRSTLKLVQTQFNPPAHPLRLTDQDTAHSGGMENIP